MINLNKIDFSEIDFKYWILISFIYFSLIFSTSLSFVYFAEPVITDSFRNCPYPDNLSNYFPDLGNNRELTSLQGVDSWKLTSIWGDMGNYIVQSDNPTSSIAPYKYRFLPPFIAGLIHRGSGINIVYSFAIMNIIFTYLIAIVLTWFTRCFFRFSKNLALIAGILAVTTVGITTTLPFPMLEPVEYFFFLLVLVSLKSNNNKLYVISAILAVLSKELLIIIGALYFANHFYLQKKGHICVVISLSALPFVIFIITRFILGGHLLEVNYGYNLLTGQFPNLGVRIITTPSLILSPIFLSFSLLWLGLLNITKDKFLFINTVVTVPLTIIAGLFLSSGLIRIVCVSYPLIIILFLYFFKDEEESKNKLKWINNEKH